MSEVLVCPGFELGDISFEGVCEIGAVLDEGRFELLGCLIFGEGVVFGGLSFDDSQEQDLLKHEILGELRPKLDASLVRKHLLQIMH